MYIVVGVWVCGDVGMCGCADVGLSVHVNIHIILQLRSHQGERNHSKKNLWTIIVQQTRCGMCAMEIFPS